MEFQFKIHSIAAGGVAEEFVDPFNRDIELYQTWHLAALDDLDDADPAGAGKRHLAARSGFSMTGAPDSGTSFAQKQERVLNDPYALFHLNEYHFVESRASGFRLDFHHWENDGASAARKVRAAFSDRTLRYMDGAWKAAKGDQAKAKKALSEWLKANGESALAEGLQLAGLGTVPWVKFATDFAPVIPLVIDYLREQGDDYFKMHRFAIKVVGGGTPLTTKWRIIPPGGAASRWVTGEGKLEFIEDIRDAGGKNWLRARYIFRMIE